MKIFNNRYSRQKKQSVIANTAIKTNANFFTKQNAEQESNTEKFFHALPSSITPQLHTDEHAHQLAQHFNARAFTYNNHIFFNNNQYQPHTTAGKTLLAHELIHVKQNRPVIAREPAADEQTKLAAAAAAETKAAAAEILLIKAFGIAAVEDGIASFTAAQLKLVTQALAKIPKDDIGAIKGAKLIRVSSLGANVAGKYSSRQGYNATSVIDEQMVELSNLCFDTTMTPEESIRVIIHEVGHAVAAWPFVKAEREAAKQGLKTNETIGAHKIESDAFDIANAANDAAIFENNTAVFAYRDAVAAKDATAIAATKAVMVAKKKIWDATNVEKVAREAAANAKKTTMDTEQKALVAKEAAAKAKQADTISFSTHAATAFAGIGTAYSTAKATLNNTDDENSSYAAAIIATQNGITTFYNNHVLVTTDEGTAEAAKAVADALVKSRNDAMLSLTATNKNNPMLTATANLIAAQNVCLKAAATVAFNRSMNLSVKKFYDLVTANNISPGITPYAEENWPHKPEEFYAEAYSFFITKPAELKAHSLKLYKWFEAGTYS